MSAPNVLVVATSHDQMGSTGHRTGVWLEELATSYYALLDGGAQVTLVSIKGGAFPWDPRSLPHPKLESPLVDFEHLIAGLPVRYAL